MIAITTPSNQTFVYPKEIVDKVFFTDFLDDTGENNPIPLDQRMILAAYRVTSLWERGLIASQTQQPTHLHPATSAALDFYMVYFELDMTLDEFAEIVAEELHIMTYSFSKTLALPLDSPDKYQGIYLALAEQAPVLARAGANYAVLRHKYSQETIAEALAAELYWQA